MQLENPVFRWTDLGVPERWFQEDTPETSGDESTDEDHAEVGYLDEVDGISCKDLILIAGGLFLIWKSVREIHHKTEGDEAEHARGQKVSFSGVLAQIVVLDVVFSLDSVITAVGMVPKDLIWVMVVAVVLSILLMLVFAGPVSNFVSRHPTLKMLALSFLILIGVMLVAEGIGTHINKGYIYFAMSFALLVEMLNLRMKAKTISAESSIAKDPSG